MADLSTYEAVEAELAATAAYDMNASLDEAKRRVAALRRKLDFAEQSDENGREIRFNHAIVQDQLAQAITYVRQNETLTDAQQAANPSVTHADFATFGQYGASG